MPDQLTARHTASRRLFILSLRSRIAIVSSSNHLQRWGLGEMAENDNVDHDLKLLLALVTAIHDKVTVGPALQINRADMLIKVPEVGFLLDATAMWLWQTDENQKFTYISPQFKALTGVSIEAMKDKSLGELFTGSPITPHDFSEHQRRLARKDIFHDYIFTIYLPTPEHDRQLFWFNHSGWPVRSDEGEFAGYVGVGRNVTDKRGGLIASGLMAVHWANAVSALNVSILVLDPQNNIFFFNERWKMLHVGMDEKYLRHGVSYLDYLTAAVRAGLFPEAQGREVEYIAWRIAQNEAAPENPITVLRQDGIVLSIKIARLRGGMTAILSTEVQGPVDRDEAGSAPPNQPRSS
jgi:PAS domain S-box-containing protein